MVIKANEKTFENEVIRSGKTVLVDFWADWCGPCRMLSPIIDEISEDREDISVVKVNVDESPGLAARFHIMSIPTVMVFKNGNVEHTSVGLKSKSELLNLL